MRHHQRQPMARPRRDADGPAGFTIIELAVVLVIIGLIIGAIVVGRDLIQAARIRADISQLQSFTIATNAFRSKYNAIPGDMKGADAKSLGLTDFGGGGDVNIPNGDGRLEDDSGHTLYPTYVLMGPVEVHSFFPELAGAQLIPGGFNYSSASDTGWLPPLKSHPTFYVWPISTTMDEAIWYFVGLSNRATSNNDFTSATYNPWPTVYTPVYTPFAAYALEDR